MEKATKNKRYKILKTLAIIMAAVLTAVTALCLIFVDNENIHYEHFELTQAAAHQEIKIAHLSDLHFPKIKVNIDRMIEKLYNESPHMIAITGDLIDRSATVGTCKVEEFIEKLKSIAPIFYVGGNHEAANHENISELYAVLRANEVVVLNDNSQNVMAGGIEVTLIGLSDNADYDKKLIEKNENARTNYKILLAHRPEKWNNYTSAEKEFEPNLILTGHAHGGQFRIFGQGLIAPGQGLFPKYDSGRYNTADGNCTMIVSRGIGSSIIPFRFNNKPHIPIITIKI